MNSELILLLIFAGLLTLMLTGLPLTFVLGGLSLFFTLALWDANAIIITVLQIFDTMRSDSLLAIPLYILMACLLQRAGVIEDLYRAMELWFARLSGGLAVGTVFICVIMAAMTGVVGAAVTSMGILALPSMLKRGYDPRLGIGTICAAGTLGILIPPSIVTIVYAVTAQISIGQMLIAGLVPGLMLAGLYIAYIILRAWRNPEMAPVAAGARDVGWAVRATSLVSLVLPFLIIVFVLGSMYLGIATPTEAAAVGVAGAIFAAVLKGQVTRGNLHGAAMDTIRATAMVLWITISAKAFVAIFTGIGGANVMLEFIRGLEADRWVVLAAMLAVLVLLGCFLDEIGIILLTLPIFIPIIGYLQFDPLWFGVLFLVTAQMAYITPPFGYTLFYIKGVLPPSLDMGVVYRSITPFFLLQLTGLLICMAFPQIVVWLPRSMLN